ncbi:MAG: hypothetical protein IJS60_08885 [Abditibacteriota bacterium]|nr:hypothetical protein [Abditibacteriota bacterium]
MAEEKNNDGIVVEPVPSIQVTNQAPEPVKQTQTTIPAPQPVIPTEPVKTIADIKKEIEKQIVDEYNQKKQAELQKQKDSELEELRKKTAELEKQIKLKEKQSAVDTYNMNFKEIALKEGATKTDYLLKLVNRDLTPEEAVKSLKSELPELFVKQATINDIGGGVTGANVNTKSPEDVGKMPISEYKKWRETNG